MKYLVFLFSFFFVLSVQSCTNDNDDIIQNPASDLVGSWKLTSWSVEGNYDINSDGVAQSNLLNEIDCANEEILVFGANGVVTSDKTFNPILKIGQMNGNEQAYIFNVECSEGYIGFSAAYTQTDGAIRIQDRIATMDTNKLTRVFENAIKIYNQDFTRVIETRDLVMVYTKQ